MSSPTDPIKRLKRLRLLIDLAAVVVCIGLAGLWYFGGDIERTSQPIDGLTDEPEIVPTAEKSDPFPVEAFAVDLWYTPPEPERVVAERPPPAPRLRLLGIRDTDSGFMAMLLDEASDDIIRARSGDDVSGVLLTSISANGVRGTYLGAPIELLLDGGGG